MRRQQSAFTLVELLCVVTIIGILASVGISNFVAARDRARAAGVRENMHTAQIAAEGYHTQTTIYADSANKMDPFFPNGSFNVGGTPGNRGNNPYTDVYNDSLYSESFSDAAAIAAARSSKPSGGPGNPGQVGYCMTTDGESYAICGLGATGSRLASSTGGTLVLSNQ
jgi:prepilin-type N-terminal cleavage/methylation domain-containing protein